MQPRSAPLSRGVWDLYFDRAVEEYQAGGALLQLIDDLVAWLAGAAPPPCLASVNWRRDRVITIPWAELKATLPPGLDAVARALAEEAHAVHAMMSVALCIVRALRLAEEARAQQGAGRGGGGGGGGGGALGAAASLAAGYAQLLGAQRDVPGYAVADKHDKMTARFSCVSPLTTLDAITARVVGSWVSLRGTVLSMSKCRARVRRLPFVCATCFTLTPVLSLPMGKWQTPLKCGARGCRSTQFLPGYEQAEEADVQRVKLQELEDDIKREGEPPRTLHVELANDLCDMVSPGAEVTIGGVVHAIEPAVLQGRGARGSLPGVYVFILEAFSLFSHTDHDDGGVAAAAALTAVAGLAGADGASAAAGLFLNITATTAAQGPPPAYAQQHAGSGGGGGGAVGGGGGRSAAGGDGELVSSFEAMRNLAAIGGPRLLTPVTAPSSQAAGGGGSLAPSAVPGVLAAGGGALLLPSPPGGAPQAPLSTTSLGASLHGAGGGGAARAAASPSSLTAALAAATGFSVNGTSSPACVHTRGLRTAAARRWLCTAARHTHATPAFAQRRFVHSCRSHTPPSCPPACLPACLPASVGLPACRAPRHCARAQPRRPAVPRGRVHVPRHLWARDCEAGCVRVRASC